MLLLYEECLKALEILTIIHYNCKTFPFYQLKSFLIFLLFFILKTKLFSKLDSIHASFIFTRAKYTHLRLYQSFQVQFLCSQELQYYLWSKKNLKHCSSQEEGQGWDWGAGTICIAKSIHLMQNMALKIPKHVVA